jgi:DNA-binding NtrC family response regulator
MPGGTTVALPGCGAMSVANVIVADDEDLLRWALVQRLRRDGHVVSEAGDGAAALDAVAAAAPHAVMLLDLKLPDMPGLSVLKEIRRRRPDVAVVMMTAYWASDALAEAQRLGVRDLLAKPLNLDRVAATVLAAKEIGTC